MFWTFDWRTRSKVHTHSPTCGVGNGQAQKSMYEVSFPWAAAFFPFRMRVRQFITHYRIWLSHDRHTCYVANRYCAFTAQMSDMFFFSFVRFECAFNQVPSYHIQTWNNVYTQLTSRSASIKYRHIWLSAFILRIQPDQLTSSKVAKFCGKNLPDKRVTKFIIKCEYFRDSWNENGIFKR